MRETRRGPALELEEFGAHKARARQPFLAADCTNTEHLTSYLEARDSGCSAAERPMAANFDAPSPALAPRCHVRDLPPGVLVATMPQAILEAGERAAFHSVEFFTARISNPHTRAA